MIFIKMLCFVVILCSVGVHGIEELLLFSDLPDLGSSEQEVRDYFKDAYGVNPDGIALNHEGAFDAVQPPITERTSRWCYKTIGAVTYNPRSEPRATQVTIDERTIENNTPDEQKMTVSVTGSWEDSVTHETSATVGLTFSQKLTVEGVFETGMSFNFETTLSESQTSTTKRTASQSVEIKVPPNSKRSVRLMGTTKVQDVDYSADITVDGFFGANFPDRVQGHYFWFESAEDILPTTSGTLTGTVTGALTSNVHTIVDAPVALTT